MKLKGKGLEQFRNIPGVKSGDNKRTRAKEGVALLILKNEQWNCVTEYMKLSSRLLWVKMKADYDTCVIVCISSPEGSVRSEEQTVF